jgi:hypothetical protein
MDAKASIQVHSRMVSTRELNAMVNQQLEVCNLVASNLLLLLTVVTQQHLGAGCE